MATRTVLLLAALATVALAADRGLDHRACKRASVEAYALGAPGGRGGDAGAVARELLVRCRGAQELTQASERMGRAGRAELRPASERLAGEAVRREPERWLSWLALAGARERRGDFVGGQHARARVRALNPRYPGQLPTGPGGAARVP